MVSDDMPLESIPLSTVTSGFTPLGMTVDSHSDSTAGTVLTSRPERCNRSTSVSTAGWLVTFVLQPYYDTVGSVMKADASSLDKTAVPGRPPRDPRIDAAILRATAELLVEIGYPNLTLAAVAERAGTTKTALYRRWSSKAELVHEAAFPRGAHRVDDARRRYCRRHPGDARSYSRRVHQPVVRAALPGLIADMSADAA